MKKIVSFFALLAIVTMAMGQVKVTTAGNVGIGTNSPAEKLHVYGNLKFGANDVKIGEWEQANRLSLYSREGYTFYVDSWSGSDGSFRIKNWTDIIFDWTGKCCGSPVIYPSTDWYLQLGKETKRIGTTYTDNLFYMAQYKFSDIRIKENITPLNNPIEKIMQLSAYTYNLKEEFYPEQLSREIKANLTKTQIGFLAQEFEQVFPELVNKPNAEDKYYSINYVDMIPVLVEAIKEQQTMIEKLQKEVETQKRELVACCNTSQMRSMDVNEDSNTQEFNLNSTINGNGDEMKVYQNAPNPFNVTTTIQCYIPQTIQKAELCVYNMQGVQIKCLPVSERGTVDMQIQAGQLTAGVYTYLLIGDGKNSDAKQMILTK